MNQKKKKKDKKKIDALFLCVASNSHREGFIKICGFILAIEFHILSFAH